MVHKRYYGLVDVLAPLSQDQRLEMIANLLISYGLAPIKHLQPDKFPVTSETKIMDIVLEDINQRGDNIDNAMVKQGVLILSWLDKDLLGD